MHLDAITPVAQDYLKAIWSATEWGEAPASTTGLAARMGTSAANVTETLRRLAAQGLVEYRPYRPVVLTAAGEAYAVAMVRRHRLVESFLAETLAYSWDEVHAEAERLEHAVSDELVDRIDTALGHPRQDPHGDPIPTAEGVNRLPAHARRLDTVPPGRYRITRISDTSSERLRQFAEKGLAPHEAVAVQAAGSSAWAVTAEKGAVELDADDAAAVWLVPEQAVSPAGS